MTGRAQIAGDYVTARLDEEEAVARAALDGLDDGGRWKAGGHDSDAERITGHRMVIYDEGGHSVEQARHIAYWGPSRVLDAVAANRAILALHPHARASEGNGFGCRTCHQAEDGWQYGTGWCGHILALAQPYSSRPDFPDELRQP